MGVVQAAQFCFCKLEVVEVRGHWSSCPEESSSHRNGSTAPAKLLAQVCVDPWWQILCRKGDRIGHAPLPLILLLPRLNPGQGFLQWQSGRMKWAVTTQIAPLTRAPTSSLELWSNGSRQGVGPLSSSCCPR